MTGERPAAPSAATPTRNWIAIAVGSAALLAALFAWIGYAAGERAAGRDIAGEADTRSVMESQLERVEFENKRLHARVAELEMARRLDRDAYGQIERTLGDLQSQLARQNDDLAFYRSIVSPADGIQGLRIQRFEALPGEKPREVQLRVTLVQAMRHESEVSGLLQLTLNGMQAGAPAKHTVGELVGRPRAQLPFSFRYFQTVEQTVTLPEGFEPYETEVRVQSSKLRGGPVQKAFPWKLGSSQAAL